MNNLQIIHNIPAILLNITQFSVASFNITESDFSQIRLNWEMLIYFYDRTFKLYKGEKTQKHVNILKLYLTNVYEDCMVHCSLEKDFAQKHISYPQC